MKTLEIELPDALAARMEELLEAGWFTSEAEIVRLALTDFLRRRPFELQERFQREDVAWALGQTAEAGDLKKRLRKDRPMTTVSLRMPEDVFQDLERVAPRLGFSGYLPLLRAYVGQGLRRDLAPSEATDDPAEHRGAPRPARLGALDHRLLQALVQLATGPEGQEEVDGLLRRYLDEEISLAKLAEMLGVSRFELQESFERLRVPVNDPRLKARASMGD